jgi:hypothetical protein
MPLPTRFHKGLILLWSNNGVQTFPIINPRVSYAISTDGYHNEWWRWNDAARPPYSNIVNLDIEGALGQAHLSNHLINHEIVQNPHTYPPVPIRLRSPGQMNRRARGQRRREAREWGIPS